MRSDVSFNINPPEFPAAITGMWCEHGYSNGLGY